MKKMVEFPCSKGDVIYLVDKIHGKVKKSIVEHVEYIENTNADFPFTMVKGEGFSIFFDDFGKLAFLNEEDANEKLKEVCR